jgi:hypothetical protein
VGRARLIVKRKAKSCYWEERGWSWEVRRRFGSFLGMVREKERGDGDVCMVWTSLIEEIWVEEI